MDSREIPPETSNFYCLPGRAGGSPNVLDGVKCGLALRKLANIRAARPGSARPTHHGKVGRKDPCPCGSGKKFKRCRA